MVICGYFRLFVALENENQKFPMKAHTQPLDFQRGGATPVLLRKILCN